MKNLSFLLACLIFSLPLFSQTSEKIQDQARLYREEGYALQQGGDLRGAAVFYQKAVNTYPAYFEAYNDLGVILESLGDKDKAIAMYEKALAYNPDYLPAYSNLAFIYEEKKDTEKATYYWKKRYQLSQDGDYWRYQAMKHLMALGTYPEVKKELLSHQVAQCYEDLAYKREQDKLAKNDQAKEYLKGGREYLRKKQYSEAAQEFESALALNPTDKALTATIGEEYVRAKKLSAKNDIRLYLDQAWDDIDKEDYKPAVGKIKEALSLIFSIEH